MLVEVKAFKLAGERGGKQIVTVARHPWTAAVASPAFESIYGTRSQHFRSLITLYAMGIGVALGVVVRYLRGTA